MSEAEEFKRYMDNLDARLATTADAEAVQRNVSRNPLAPAVPVGVQPESAEPYASIHAERVRAHAKHGAKSMESQPWQDPIGKRLRILVEEVGEVAREFNDADIEGRPVDRVKLRSEVMQVSAMAVGWLAAIDGEALT